jgi:hypothetical protein
MALFSSFCKRAAISLMWIPLFSASQSDAGGPWIAPPRLQSVSRIRTMRIRFFSSSENETPLLYGFPLCLLNIRKRVGMRILFSSCSQRNSPSIYGSSSCTPNVSEICMMWILFFSSSSQNDTISSNGFPPCLLNTTMVSSMTPLLSSKDFRQRADGFSSRIVM